MARRKKEGGLDILVDIAATFPWWVGVLLAIVSYFVLHHYATAEINQVAVSGQLVNFILPQLIRMFAMIGQYLLPFAFLIGAVMSAAAQLKRTTLFEGVRGGSSAAALNDMTWHEFEMLVGEAFRRDGYAVTENGGGGADGGIDLILKKGGEKFLVQCKQWRAYKVGVTTIRELYGVMAAGGAAGGFVVTSGVYTTEAKSFAEDRNIDLIDGNELMEIIKILRPQSQYSNATSQPNVQVLRTSTPFSNRSKFSANKENALNPIALGAMGLVIAIVIIFALKFVYDDYVNQHINQPIQKILEQGQKEAEAKYIAQMQIARQRDAQLAEQQKNEILKQQLEVKKNAAWLSYYKEPVGCDNFRSDQHMVECINYKMRAQHKFEILFSAGELPGSN
jgi:restriction system protein